MGFTDVKVQGRPLMVNMQNYDVSKYTIKIQLDLLAYTIQVMSVSLF